MLHAPKFVLEALIEDVIWPARFAAQGWIAALSDRFTATEAFFPGAMPSNTYDGNVWGVPWYTALEKDPVAKLGKRRRS